MNILLVDDEYYNIESLEKKIEAYFDVFEHIFCAYSKEQALRYFEDNVIDIMICDIEMPGGSGLELLEQIRIRNNNQTICIFLTAFARFEYASKALKLSSFDYLLKPVKDETLRLSVQRAIDERRKKSLEEENAEMAAFWKEGELYLTEQLWSDVIHGNIAGSKAGIERELHLRKLDGKIVDKQYFFLMIYSMPNGELYNHMSKELYNFTLKNILRDFSAA